ncbi:5'-flap endonuclease [Conoideocrella luteorostrata]|uniref:Structure-specific endonuclease subunit SLX4 n=1 Tax=Conoideocrella luteorostrata TaxID=1105319 RepID=A0AAJ0CSE1_9HYPO|nr:5'-flap endonuclease [Conoideocrella luteorostrata]
MASPDVFLSSPPRAARRLLVPSSSPDLPPMQDILSQQPKRPAIKSGSKAMPIPDDAISIFTSACDLWKSAQATQISNSRAKATGKTTLIDDIDVILPPTQHSPKIKTPARRVKQRKNNGKAKQHVDDGDPQAGEVGEPAEQPWKKFKPKTPEKDAAQVSYIKKSEVPSTMNLATSSTAVEACSPTDVLPRKAKYVAKKWDLDEPLQLEPAMERRKDWTPPPKQAIIIPDSDTSQPEADSAKLEDGEEATSFGSLLDGYKCSDSGVDESIAHSYDSDSKKRKLTSAQSDITIIPPPVSVVKPVAKQRAPRKKPRTITGLATAAYKQPTQVESVDAEQDAARPPQSAVHSKAATTAKPRKRPSKSKKKPEPPKPVLFSPETALKQVAQQDFVFGTSSQLATEKSPTFLRNLQRAMRTSNQLDDIDFTTPLNSDAIELMEPRPKLWDAAARDADGDLFDLEVINLTEGDSGLPQTPGNIDPFGYFKGDDKSSPQLPRLGKPTGPVEDDGGFVNLSDILPDVVSNNANPEPKSPRYSEYSPFPKLRSRTEPVRPSTIEEPETNSTQLLQSPGPADGNRPSRPALEQYTDAQLAKEVSRYGFKAIKRRSAMITLLDQCWQQKNASRLPQVRLKSTAVSCPKSTTTTSPAGKRVRGRPRKNSADESQLQEPPPSAQVPQTPKQPRGRPRKDSQTSWATKPRASKQPVTPTRVRNSITAPEKLAVTTVIEIPDSEAEPASTLCSSSTPSPSPSSTFSSPRQVDLTMSLDEDTELSLSMTPTDKQSNLFEHITKAVMTAPRTTTPTQPSWYEKILLYDPIVLEDLASWLNSGQLTRVGCDEEVHPAELKKWCESKSICCLWRVNLRGKERKRY